MEGVKATKKKIMTNNNSREGGQATSKEKLRLKSPAAKWCGISRQ